MENTVSVQGVVEFLPCVENTVSVQGVVEFLPCVENTVSVQGVVEFLPCVENTVSAQGVVEFPNSYLIQIIFSVCSSYRWRIGVIRSNSFLFPLLITFKFMSLPLLTNS